ncbi:MAG: hypothetical protein K2P53_01680 [Rickettsiales bacterium]|nr:hypothetical protein [Silvanigrellaceae bacterium]MBY0580383.1 hypothetical protein [Rickettsiales bacterium]
MKRNILTLILVIMSFTLEAQKNNLQQKEQQFNYKPFFIDKAQIKPPCDLLLTQPLLTLGIEEYYQRTSKIKIIKAEFNNKKNIYSRSIIMIIDSNKNRNNVEAAIRKKEEVRVEFALIHINFKQIPKKMQDEIMYTNIPFGKLLVNNKIETTSTNRKYFYVYCNKDISKIIFCKKNNKIYGRINRIISKENNKWIANVTEILSGTKCKDKTCNTLIKQEK